MPIKNMWSLNPGEVLAAEQLPQMVPNCQVYFPLRDVGIDLLVVRGERHCGLQVKASRYYRGVSRSGKAWGNSWHQVRQNNLIPEPSSQKLSPDFYIFLTFYDRRDEKKGTPRFEERYLIVPTADLRGRLKGEHPGNGVHSFNFEFLGERVVDTRKKPYGDFTEFWNNWKSIATYLER